MKIESIVQPITYHLSPNDSLSKVAKWLADEGKTALPVIDQDGTLLGLITAQDVIAANAEASDRAELCAIAELVKPGSITGTLGDDVASLANKAISQNQTHIVVVDDLGKVMGIADLSQYQGSSHEAQHNEEDLDEALDETFPSSDPISPP